MTALPSSPLPVSAPESAPADALVTLDGTAVIPLEVIDRVAHGKVAVVISPAGFDRMTGACRVLDRLKAENRLIYGVTTGFGPLARSYVDESLSQSLQENLVYHLASGVGRFLSPPQARAVTMARLVTLVRGHSAARAEVARLLADVLNKGLAPAIPEKGTVGASGDLTPLSHLALALMGEGAFLDEQGQPVPARAALSDAGLEPLTLKDKDGLALVNGISATAGIAALNGVAVRRLARLALAMGLGYTELLGGHRSAWHPLIGSLRPHSGQKQAHELLWAWSMDSGRLQPVDAMPPRHGETLSVARVIQDQPLPQDPYSMRCLPQLVGAVFDMVDFHDRIIETDLNAVSDNPLIFPDSDGSSEETPMVLHGGNFFGQHGAFVGDTLTNATITLASLFERQIARITDPELNGSLPAFLQARETGLHSGFMGAQVTASALLAELRAKSVPASIQSISTNGNNQDVVPLGTIAARRAREALEDTHRVAAILLLCLAQAADLTSGDTGAGRDMSQKTRNLVAAVRERASFLESDRPLSMDIETVAAALDRGEIAP